MPPERSAVRFFRLTRKKYRVVSVDEINDRSPAASDLLFFLGSFGVLAALVGSAFIVASVTI